MMPRPWLVFCGILAVFVGLLATDAGAQPTPDWWAPVHTQVSPASLPNGSSSPTGNRAHRTAPQHHRGPHAKQGLHIPKGHRPPPGQCRLWHPGRPPGQQPPPTSCRTAYRQRRGSAVVVTHRGPVQRPAPHWRAGTHGNIVFRRTPRNGSVDISVDIIIDMLGQEGVHRLRERRRQLDIRGPLTGRWVSTGDGQGGALQIRAGSHPLAELVDRTGNGRVDAAFYAQRPR